MFRKPRFPLPTLEKVHIEKHFDWLHRRFGIQPIRDQISLTIHSAAWKQWQRDARTLAEGQLSQQVYQDVRSRLPFPGLDCELIAWDGQSQVPRAPDIILLNPQQQLNLESMVHAIAGHLSRRFIGSLDPSEWGPIDPGSLVELLLVYFGFGVCAANMSLQTSQYTVGEQHRWHHQKHTQSAARHFGVALAYRVWMQGDSLPELTSVLRPDARVPLQRAHAFLQHTNDTLFDPRSEASLFNIQQVPRLQDWLRHASNEQVSSGQIVGVLQRLLDLTQPGELSPDGPAGFLFRQIPELLRSPDASIRWLSCRAADCFHVVQGQVLEGLRDLLTDPDPQIRSAAMTSLVYGAPTGEFLARDLLVSLKDEHAEVVQAAVQGVIYLQQQEEDLVPGLLALIRRSLNLVTDIELDYLCAALDTASPGADKHLQGFLQGDPGELQLVMQRLHDWRSSRGSQLGEGQIQVDA